MPSPRHETTQIGQPLKQLSSDRLVSLLLHWTWADEAKLKFERELASCADEHSSGSSDRLLGSYYHWCALLCAIGEATFAHSLASQPPLEPVRDDIHALLPWLRVCRKRLMDVPASHESHPSLADLRRDIETLARLRRVHRALGEALHSEQVSRDMDSLDDR